MATTLYLRSTAATGVKPATKQSSTTITEWYSDNQTAITCLDMLETQGAAKVNILGTFAEAGSAHYGWSKAYISPPLQAQTVGGTGWTITGVLDHVESNAKKNSYPRIFVYVWKADNSGIQGTLLANTNSGTESATSEADTTYFNAIALSAVVCSAGDRIVIELMQYHNNTGTASYTDTHYYDSASTPGVARFTFNNTITFQGVTEYSISKAGAWRVMAELSSSKTSNIRVKGEIPSERTSAWRTKAEIPLTKTADLRVQGEEPKAKTADLRVKGEESPFKPSDWSVVAEILESKLINWRLLGEEFAALLAKWRTKGEVPSSITSDFGVIAEIPYPRISKWCVLAGVPSELLSDCRVKGEIPNGKTANWTVYAEEEPTPPTDFMVSVWKTAIGRASR